MMTGCTKRDDWRLKQDVHTCYTSNRAMCTDLSWPAVLVDVPPYAAQGWLDVLADVQPAVAAEPAAAESAAVHGEDVPESAELAAAATTLGQPAPPCHLYSSCRPWSLQEQIQVRCVQRAVQDC